MSPLRILSVITAILAVPAILSAQEPAPFPQAFDAHGDPLPAFARARLGTIRFRHDHTVSIVRFAPDGQTLLAIDHEDSILRARVWETATGRERSHFTLPTLRRRPFALAADPRLLATWINEDSLLIWDTSNGQVMRRITEQGVSLGHACFTADGKGILALRIDPNNEPLYSIVLWDIATGRELRRFVAAPGEKKDPIFRPEKLFMCGDRLLAAVGTDGTTLRLWDFASAKELPVRVAYPGSRQLPVLSPDGKLLVGLTGFEDDPKEVRVWDVASGNQLHELDVAKEPMGALVFSPDSKVLATRQKNILSLWDLQTGKRLAAPDLAEGEVTDAVFAPDGRTIAIAKEGELLYLCDRTSGKVLHQLTCPVTPLPRNMLRPHGEHALAFTPDGRTLAAASFTRVRLWNVTSGREIEPVASGHRNGVAALALSSDGQRLVSSGYDEKIRLWELSSGRELRALRLPGEATQAEALSLSADGRLLASSHSWPGAVCVWELASGKLLRRIDEEGKSAVFSPDGRALATPRGRGEVVWWDVATGERLRTHMPPRPRQPQLLELEPPAQMLLSPDGRLVIAVSSSLLIYERATGKLRRQVPPPGPPPMFFHEPENTQTGFGGMGRYASAAFAPDSKMLAWCILDQVTLLDLVSGKELRHLNMPRGELSRPAFAPDGKLLAAAGTEGTLRFWNPASGTLLGEVNLQRGGFSSLVFTADGKTLITGGSDGCLLLWDVARILEHGQTQPRLPAGSDPALLWQKLGEAEDTELADLMQRLIASPEQAVPLIKGRLAPVPDAGAERIKRLVADLESAQFDTRKKATEELLKLGELADAALRARRATKPPLEVQQRIDSLLQKLEVFISEPGQARALRAVEVLERIGTLEAQAVLRELAGGAKEARLTVDARGALARLAQHSASKP